MYLLYVFLAVVVLVAPCLVWFGLLKIRVFHPVYGL